MQKRGISEQGSRAVQQFQASYLPQVMLLSHWPLDPISLAYDGGFRGHWIWRTTFTPALHAYELIRSNVDKPSTYPPPSRQAVGLGGLVCILKEQ